MSEGLSLPPVITDNGTQAKRDYPGHAVLASIAALLDLPQGTPVICAWYRIGSHVGDMRTAGELLLRNGTIREASPELPWGETSFKSQHFKSHVETGDKPGEAQDLKQQERGGDGQSFKSHVERSEAQDLKGKCS